MSQKKSKTERVIEIFREADPNECKILLEVARAISKEKIDSLRRGPTLQIAEDCICDYDKLRSVRIINHKCKAKHLNIWFDKWPESPDYVFKADAKEMKNK